jgi:DNA-binding NarL/FixJ family response regulator
MEGIVAAHTIRVRHPSTGVVVLSQHAAEGYAFELLKHGTAHLAYLLKDRVGDLDQLLGAIRTVHHGGSVIDPKVVEALIARRARLVESSVAKLAPREREVLAEMAEGKTNAGIAASLHLSASSVEKYVNTVFGKLGLHDEPETHRRVAAVLAYLRDADIDRGEAQPSAEASL